MSAKAASPHPLRALVIGAGPSSQMLHLPVLARLRDRGELLLTCICDLQPVRAATARRKFGFTTSCSDAITALEQPGIDAVYIFGSATLHHEYGSITLRHGRHLFVEKPIAPSYAQALELAETAQANNLIAVAGHNRRFLKAIATVRARGGKTGWRFGEAVFHKPEFGHKPRFGAATWLGDNGIHALDALLFAMGSLPSFLSALHGERIGEEGALFSAIMRWEDGAQATFLCNNHAGERREEYAFHRARETCRITQAGLTVAKDGARSRPVYPLKNDGFAAEHAAFVQAIRDGHAPPHAISAIAPSLYLAELIEHGFSGPVQWPIPLPKPTTIPHPVAVRHAVLVVEPPSGDPVFHAALAHLLPTHRLVPFEELCSTSGIHPDIVAAILGRGAPALSRVMLDRLPNLAVVGVMALSLARYDPDALLTRGVALVNASSAYAESVADFAFGLAILGRRRAFASHEIMRAGGWDTGTAAHGRKTALHHTARPLLRAAGLEPAFQRVWRKIAPLTTTSGITGMGVHDLSGATTGLIGWGANARALAARLARARVQVMVYSEHAADSEIIGAVRASLGEVLSADIVSLHRGLTSATRHFLGRAELECLRPGAVLINVARGALIDPDALLARLKRGDIFACLDTFAEEPLPPSHPLRELPNVFLTSHIAGGSADMHAAAADEVVQKVLRYLNGSTVETISAAQLGSMT